MQSQLETGHAATKDGPVRLALLVQLESRVRQAYQEQLALLDQLVCLARPAQPVCLAQQEPLAPPESLAQLAASVQRVSVALRASLVQRECLARLAQQVSLAQLESLVPPEFLAPPELSDLLASVGQQAQLVPLEFRVPPDQLASAVQRVLQESPARPESQA